MVHTTDLSRTNLPAKTLPGRRTRSKTKTIDDELRYLVPWEIANGNKRPLNPQQSYEDLIRLKRKLIHQLTNINEDLGKIKKGLKAK